LRVRTVITAMLSSSGYLSVRSLFLLKNRMWWQLDKESTMSAQSPSFRLSLVALLGNASRLGSQHVETGRPANVRRGHVKEQEPFPAFLCRTTDRVFLKREDE
jgi:hypothetical protein